ncbi:hypothetical protein O6H91_12G005000 [Diphasiastrum complanatum]|uniref:Uncharacterized protein n=1 Tax=Diphasiastrum complanatum TaxID=34168 RepID=A0ACC2BYW7_DIPCM|nr:hypothetical protein O6H91_12G005000 [Diphasiastrum complanatum]
MSTMFDGVNRERYQGKVPSFTGSRNRRRGYCSRCMDLVLRILATVLTLIAFTTMASDSKSSLVVDSVTGEVLTLKLKYTYSDSTKAILAADVIVFMYSLAHTVAAFKAVCSGSGCLPSPVSQYLSFILDQVLVYLLLACSASGATMVHLLDNGAGDLWPSLCKGTGLRSFCSLAAASVAMSFLAFFILAFSAIQSSYLLSKYNGGI